MSCSYSITAKYKTTSKPRENSDTMIWVSHNISNFQRSSFVSGTNNNKNLNATSEVSNHNNMKIKEISIFGALTRRRCKRVSINFAMSLCPSALYSSRIVSVLRFSQWCGWLISTSGMWHCVTAYLVPNITRKHSGIIFKGLTIHKNILQTSKMRTLWSSEPDHAKPDCSELDHAELKQGLHLQIFMWRQKKEKGMTKVNWHNLFFYGLCPLSTF